VSFTSTVTNEVRGQIGVPFGWWRRWPSWVGFAASLGVGLALYGTGSFVYASAAVA
jgi:hypothetical protein